MPSTPDVDHYETLQVSPRADGDTIERVFRHLAKRYHPDNSESGDAERFAQIVAAQRTLSDPEARAAYDAQYREVQRHRWKIFDQAASTRGVEGDRRIRVALLTLLYQARRRDVDNPGVGILDLERILDCPRDHMEFHIWYMKESGWISRLDTGHLAITVQGVNHLDEQPIPWSTEERQLGPGDESLAGAGAASSATGGGHDHGSTG